ncbi:PBP1A family penicillin-binding protein [bacterium]|nr:PBP1A family penicillin-binding protein [bacterium]
MRFTDFWTPITRLNIKARIVLVFCAFVVAFCSYIVVLYFHSAWRIESYLRSQPWSLPSTLYAEAPLLRVGMPIKTKTLVDYFRQLNYHKHTSNQSVIDGTYVVSSNGIIFQKRQLYDKQPKYHPIRVDIKSDRISRIVDLKTSRQINTFALEPYPIRVFFGKDIEKRRLISYDEIPKSMIQAVVAIEDRRFYRHHGIDFQGIARALWDNLSDDKTSQGGSTITQQLAKNIFLTRERSIQRKIREVILATLLESRLSKEKILELYLNEIYLGQQGAIAIHGIGEASRFYFAKDAQHLSTAEAALLAGMIQAPSALNPYHHRDLAKKRRDTVMFAMQDQKCISENQYTQLVKSPVAVRQLDTRIDAAPYFSDMVKSQLLQKYDEKTLYSKNLSIFTTLNLEMQQAAEQALSNGLKKIDAARYSKNGKNVQGCLIALEPQTGYIRALVGGRSYAQGQFNRVIQASRQPGSAFKPVVYAAALEQSFSSLRSVRVNSSNGRFFTPATLMRDEPWLLSYSNKQWEPKNYDGYYHGDVTLRTALAHSLNVPTAKLASQLGWKNILKVAEEFGFTNIKPYPSLALGAFEASPWQMAEAYTAFANQGLKTDLSMVKSVNNSKGEVLQKNKIESTRIIHPQTAFLLTDMLQSAMLYGTAASSQRSGFTRPAAGKTGTTDDFHDAWFAGYTPQLLCIVWVGYDDNTTIEMNGAKAALPIWLDFMKKAMARYPEENFKVPDGIVLRRIDPMNGQLATDSCPVSINEIFIKGTEPREYCEEHDDWGWTDRTSNYHAAHRRNPWFKPDKIWKQFRKLFN